MYLNVLTDLDSNSARSNADVLTDSDSTRNICDGLADDHDKSDVAEKRKEEGKEERSSLKYIACGRLSLSSESSE